MKESLNKPKYIKRWEDPEKIPKNTLLSKDEIRHKISIEGLGFCIFEYIRPDQIEDEKLQTLWIAAKKAMKAVKVYVYDK